MLLTDKNNVELLESSDAMRIKYHPIKLEDQWKVGMIQEINQMRNDKLEVEGFTDIELEEILEHLCSG